MESKERYLEYLKEQLDGWVAEVKELKDKAKAAGSDAAKKYPEQINALEEKIEVGRIKIKEFAEANEESWDSLKEGFDSAWKALAAGVKEAADKFSWEKDK